MDRSQVVRDILISCAAEKPADALKLTGKDALAALITEVDRTVLARRLVCRFEDDCLLSLFAQNRRLHMASCTGGIGGDAFETDLGPDQAHLAAQALSELCSDRTLLSITPETPNDLSEYQSLGISTARLLLSAGIDASHSPWRGMTERFEQFQSERSENIRAVYSMEDEEVFPIAGEDNCTEHNFDCVLNVLQSVTQPEFALAQLLETEGAILTPHPSAKDGCFLIIGTTGSLTVAVLENMSVIETWEALRKS